MSVGCGCVAIEIISHPPDDVGFKFGRRAVNEDRKDP
jgi:hypothetical protein